ncbi:ATP phosphoribosyltransferase (ATP-PRTase) (ATP-PRT) [Elasticomyces elasticus]|nr:ATP phosphoribosyltransferase (ATP-PRTase) (ATP-PRT) [Elasticomyces elasticus]
MEGRLQQAMLTLLHGSDIQFHRHSRSNIALVHNLPVAIVFLPAADIPSFVGEGRVDLGITGRDQVAEHEAGTLPSDEAGVEQVLDLGFGRCILQVQEPEKRGISDSEDLIGKNICTIFIKLAEAYFANLEEEGLPDTLVNWGWQMGSSN